MPAPLWIRAEQAGASSVVSILPVEELLTCTSRFHGIIFNNPALIKIEQKIFNTKD